MRMLLRTVGQSLLRLIEQSEDALSVWDDALTDDLDALRGDDEPAPRPA